MKYTHYILAVIAFFGFTFVAEAQWTAPTATPPNNNVAAPLNTSTTAQNKGGSLGVNGFANFGTSVLYGDVSIGSVPCYQCDTFPKHLTMNFGNIFVPLGKIAVGLSNPDRQVHVHSANSQAGIAVSTGSTNWMQIYQPYNQGVLRIGQGSFNGNSVSDIATFKATGEVGIGTTNPNNRLTVMGPNQTWSQAIAIDSPATGQQSSIGFNSAGSQKWQLGRNNDDSFYLWNSGRTQMDISVNNSTGITEINKLKLGNSYPLYLIETTNCKGLLYPQIPGIASQAVSDGGIHEELAHPGTLTVYAACQGYIGSSNPYSQIYQNKLLGYFTPTF